MSFPRPVRVIGVGSPQGDDAVAWRVVGRMREQIGTNERIAFHRVDGGQRLLDLLDGRGTAVILDAAEGAGTLGTMVRLHWPNDQLGALRPGTTHDLDLDAALRLAETVGVLPPNVVVYAIAAESFSPGDELSPPLAAAVPALAARVISDVGLAEQEAPSCTKPRS